MKIQPRRLWQEGEVETGMIVCRRHDHESNWKPDGWRAKWTHKIGFVPGDKGGEGDGQYCQVAMTDGMVYARGMTKAQMAKCLTDQDMIPMPYSWWIKMVRFLRRQTNPL